MLRPITPDDTNKLIALADSLGLFSSDELESLHQMLQRIAILMGTVAAMSAPIP